MCNIKLPHFICVCVSELIIEELYCDKIRKSSMIRLMWNLIIEKYGWKVDNLISKNTGKLCYLFLSMP